MKTVLSIAGSDCSGGAGVQADIKTCAALGVYCATAITAVTVQNPYRFVTANYVGDRLLRDQLEIILEAQKPDAVKIGMLPCISAIEVTADTIRRHRLINVVLDPVLGATSAGETNHICVKSETDSSGEERKEFIEKMRSELFPLCTLVTPNLPELDVLLPEYMHTDYYPDMESSGKVLLESCSMRGGVLIKGGHAEGDVCEDILVTSEGITTYKAGRIDTTHTHGTGCTLSTAIAASLARGYTIEESVRLAKEFTRTCIGKAAFSGLFSYNGPLIHF